MTGWEKVIAATVLAVIGLVGLNLAIWRRTRAARRASAQIHAVTEWPPSIEQPKNKEQ